MSKSGILDALSTERGAIAQEPAHCHSACNRGDRRECAAGRRTRQEAGAQGGREAEAFDDGGAAQGGRRADAELLGWRVLRHPRKVQHACCATPCSECPSDRACAAGPACRPRCRTRLRAEDRELLDLRGCRRIAERLGRFDSGADRGAGRGAPRRSNDRGRAPTRSRSPARASRDDAVVNAPTSDWSATRFSAQPHKRRTCLRPNKAIGEAGGASSFVRAVAAGARSGQQSKIRTDSGESGTAGTKPRGPAQQGRRRWNTRWD